VELGNYEIDAAGVLLEASRAWHEVFVPLAHTEAGLSASMLRGMQAVLDSGGVRTYVLHDRMTRASCFVFDSTPDAVCFARWIASRVNELRDWLHDLSNP